MLSQERIDTLNKVLDDLTENFTKSKHVMLGIVDQMFITMVVTNEWDKTEQEQIFKEVVRPMQERVLKAVYEREGN